MSTELKKHAGTSAPGVRRPTRGQSHAGARALGLVARWKAESLVDVGCGWNEFATAWRSRNGGRRAVGVGVGVGPACPGADVTAAAARLPFRDKEFDVLTCLDMQEDLPPAEVDAALAEMARVSQRFVVCISPKESVDGREGGTPQPPAMVRAEAWWMRRLMAAGALGIVKHGRLIAGRWAPVLKMDPQCSVVLVGNGPSVLQSRLGPAIDTFDEVVRFNNFLTKGYEAHVGTRTTLWSAFFKKDPNRECRHPRVFSPLEKVTAPPAAQAFFRSPGFFAGRLRRQIQDLAYLRGGFKAEAPAVFASSGLLMTCYLLDVVGVERVHLAGFDHFSQPQHHYWKQGTFKRPTQHDGEVEAGIFAALREAGRVRYL